MESEIKYDLEQPFDYSFKGDQQTASHIILKEPNASHLAEVGKIRKWLNQALRENRDRNAEAVEEAQADAKIAQEADVPSDEDEDEDGLAVEPEVMIGILSASEVPLDKLYTTAQSIMLAKGMAMIDGQTTLLQPHLKLLSGHDMELMVGTFIASFFLR